jgi:hypothetical protein
MIASFLTRNDAARNPGRFTLTARQVLANAYYSAGEFGQAILILEQT